MDRDKKEVFDEILNEHPLLAEAIVLAYNELGPYGLEHLIKEPFTQN